MATFNVNITDIDVNKDADAANFIVDQANEQLAAQDPPGTPYPKATGAELKSSYEAIMGLTCLRAHESYKVQAADQKSKDASVQDLWKNVPNSVRDQIVTLLEDNQL